MAYATTDDVQARLTTELSESQLAVCENLLDDAAIIIDAYNEDASEDAKLVVSVRMVLRAMVVDADIPLGASQGSMSALGYSQSWTMGTNASVGELYLGKLEKKLLGVGNAISSYSPVEELVEEDDE